MLPTGTGKTLIGIMYAERLAKEGRKILVLEPTRLLVEQTYQFYKAYSSLSVEAYHGLMRERPSLQRQVIITTPESALSLRLGDTDVVIVDECHHAIGNDPLKKLLESLRAEYRLGLSAHIPSRHKKTITSLIGPIIQWSYDDPLIRPYIAEWVAEVYESPLGEKEREVYNKIEELFTRCDGKERMLYRLALTYLSRDGALALKESISRKTKLASLLSSLGDDILSLEDLHKWNTLKSILEEHEYSKAIIFVDRVVVAKRIADKLDAALITGRKSLKEKRKELEEAKNASIVVSTSAGEEGVDLPTADLLIVWSNTPSPLRFIQRRGRVLRPVGRIPKVVAFIVTPDTIDMDFFVESLFSAKQVGVDIGVLEAVVEKYMRLGWRGKILKLLEEPMPEEWIAKLAGLPMASVKKHIRMLCESGDIVVVFTERGRSYLRTDVLPLLEERYPELFEGGNVKIELKTRDKRKKPPFLLERVVIREKKGDVEYVYVLKVGCLVDERTLKYILRHYSSPHVYRVWG